MLALPDIYVLKTESIQKKTFSEDNLNKKLDEKNINNENFDKKFLIKIDDLDLPVRVLNFLKTENINYVGELIQYTEKDILSFPNSGRKSLQDIKYELSQINLTLGTKLDKETNLYKNIEEVDEYKIKHKLKEEQLKILITEIRNTNLSQRSVNGLLNIGCVQAADILKFQISDLKRMPNLGVSSIKEIELFLKDMNLEFNDELAPWNEEIIQECKVYFNNKKKNDYLNVKSYQNEKFLEEEILRVLSLTVNASARKNAVAKNKSLEILINRFGLDGSPPKTLEIIGQKFNVTRERIRQIIKSSLEKLKKLNPPTPILNNIFLIISDLLPLSEIELNKILKEKKITKQDWDFKGLQYFYETFDTKLDFSVTQINNGNFISKLNIEKIFDKIFNYMNKKISNSGIFSLSQCLNLKEIHFNNIKKEMVKKIIVNRPQFRWLDECENYFTYYSRRNRLSNLISKVAATSKTVDLDILFYKIKKHHKISEEITYDKNILLNFIKICFDCSVDKKDQISFKSSQSNLTDFEGYRGKVVSPNEQKIIDIFKNFGPILSIDDLKEFSHAESVGIDSLVMILQSSPIFHRIDIGFYKLAGNTILVDMKKYISVINIESSTFSTDNCPAVKSKNTYVELNKNGHLFKTLPYQRPLRKLPDGSYGVVYKKKVYPIIKSIIEENGKRENIEIN
jgi:DNA-directed RNA polymerase alpha subunit